MSGPLIDGFAQLTGEELYQLLQKMARSRVTLAITIAVRGELGHKVSDFRGVSDDVSDVWNDAVLQMCRVHVTLAYAERLILRDVSRHRSPVLVAGVS